MLNKFSPIHFYAVPYTSILREIPLNMLDKQLLQKIRKLIAKGQLNDALSELVMIAANEEMKEYNDLLLLSAKYKELEKLELDNRISFENYQKGSHQLLRSLITMLDDLEKGTLSTVKPGSTPSLAEIYKTSVARTKVIQVLIASEKGLTIKAIYQLSDLKYRKYLVAALDELIAGGIVERYREDGDSLNRLYPDKKGLVAGWI